MREWVFVVEVRGLLIPGHLSEGKTVGVVVMREGRLVDMSSGAAERGLVEGMTDRETVLRCPGVVNVPLRAAFASAAQRALTRELSVLSETVERWGERGGIVHFSLPLPASQLAEPWLDLVRRLVPRLGFAVLGGAGPDLRTARAFLRVGLEAPGRFDAIGPAWGRLFLGDAATLPATVLWDLDAGQRERLRRLGLRTVGEVLARPQSERQDLIGSREEEEGQGWGPVLTGTSGMRGHGSERATGVYERAVRRAPEAGPVTDLPSLETWLGSIATELADRLRPRGMGACRLGLALHGERGVRTRERVFFSPLLPHRLFPVLKALLQTCEHPGPVREMAVDLEAERIVVVQRRLGPGAGVLGRFSDGGGSGMEREVRMTQRGDARMRRELRLALWDPLRMSRT